MPKPSAYLRTRQVRQSIIDDHEIGRELESKRDPFRSTPARQHAHADMRSASLNASRLSTSSSMTNANGFNPLFLEGRADGRNNSRKYSASFRAAWRFGAVLRRNAEPLAFRSSTSTFCPCGTSTHLTAPWVQSSAAES